MVNYGEVMLRQGIDRDALRRMPLEQQQEQGLRAACTIAQESKGITILDTHACIKTDVGYCPGLPLKVLNALNPKALVLIEASPAQVIERRSRDHSRQRDQESEQEITCHLQLTLDYLAAASILTGALFCRIENGNRAISENIQPLLRLIKSLA